MASSLFHYFAFLLIATVCLAERPAPATPDLQGRWYLIEVADTDGDTGGDCQTVDYQLIAKLGDTRFVYNVTRGSQDPVTGNLRSFSFIQTFDGRAFTSPGNRPGAVLFQWPNFVVLIDVPTGVPGALSRWPSSSGHLRRAIQINLALGFPPVPIKQGFNRCTYAPEPKNLKCH